MISNRDFETLKRRVEAGRHNPVCEDDLIVPADLKLIIAEVEHLRGELAAARDALHNDFEPDNQSRAYKRAPAALERWGSAHEQAMRPMTEEEDSLCRKALRNSSEPVGDEQKLDGKP